MYTLNTLSIIKHFSKLYNSFTLYFEIHRIFIYIIIFHIFINWQEKLTGKFFLSFEKTGKFFPQDFFSCLNELTGKFFLSISTMGKIFPCFTWNESQEKKSHRKKIFPWDFWQENDGKIFPTGIPVGKFFSITSGSLTWWHRWKFFCGINFSW